MRILIVGAGALGGMVGANLARAGEDVALLEVNTARARLLNDEGLGITRMGEEEVTVPVRVVTSVTGLEPFDLVFIAVKTYETEDAVRSVIGATSSKTLFLSLQNGIGNAEKIAGLVGAERVLCGITYHSIQHTGPRRLQYRAGIKPIQIAPFSPGAESARRLETIAEVFRRAGMATEVVSNVDHAVWQKLLHNAVVNPTSALTGLTCREMLQDEYLMAFMRELCSEIVAVMRARGIPIVDEEDPFRPVIGSLKALGKNRPSMWQDLARGKRTEVDALNGAIADEAQRLGIPAPHNRAIARFIHSREGQKFLNKEAIERELGLDARSMAERATTPAWGRPMTRAEDGGMASSGPPLESTRRLRELVRAYYRDLALASDDPRRLVAACSGLGPAEVVRALDMVPYFPENHAALIAATRQGSHAIARATNEGFSHFASSAMRADIGALLEGTSPLVAARGISGVPRPHVVVYSTNTGHQLLRWFEFYGAHYGVPVAGLHPPPALGELEQIDVEAAVQQLLRLVRQLESATGRTLQFDRLGEIVGWSAQASALWDEIIGLARAVPAPMTFFDTLTHLAPMVLLRGTPAAVSYYRELRDELEHRLTQGIGAVPDERHRFYWDGPPIWCALRPLSRLFADNGVAIVASTFCGEFVLPGLDAADPIESMARAYTGVFGNRSEDYKTTYLAARFEEYGVGAAIYHDCRTTPEASHVRYGLAVRTERVTGVPSFVVEADSHDLRLFSAERLQAQLRDFIEQHVDMAAH